MTLEPPHKKTNNVVPDTSLEASKKLETLDLEGRGIVLSK